MCSCGVRRYRMRANEDLDVCGQHSSREWMPFVVNSRPIAPIDFRRGLQQLETPAIATPRQCAF